MCGIVGYIGSQSAAPVLIEGLYRLEYRGYDSAGIAVLGSRGTQVFRKVGRVRDLLTEEIADAQVALYTPPAVSGLGSASGFKIIIEDRADLGLVELQRQVADRTLDAATSTRVVRLLPNRSGASNTPAIVIGGGEAQLMDFRIDETRSPYKDFRVTIDRVDQGRVMVIDNLTKDSNGHLRLAVNSSAFGPGNYQLTIEGLTMRLEPQPDSWVTIGVVQR